MCQRISQERAESERLTGRCDAHGRHMRRRGTAGVPPCRKICAGYQNLATPLPYSNLR
jgi:hypothetical protein